MCDLFALFIFEASHNGFWLRTKRDKVIVLEVENESVEVIQDFSFDETIIAVARTLFENVKDMPLIISFQLRITYWFLASKPYDPGYLLFFRSLQGIKVDVLHIQITILTCISLANLVSIFFLHFIG